MGTRILKVARLLAASVVMGGASVAIAGTAEASAPGHDYRGLAFDACSTPSVNAMRAWLRSPFRGVNIYIGGGDRGCSQPNLTAGWVRTVTGMGWRLIPTYVSLQAPGNSCRCSAMNPRWANAEGIVAADHAVESARNIGIGRGNPIYDDMESYVVDWSNTRAVLSFLEGWTGRLHGLGYRSGVYSSADSGIADLISMVGSSYHEPNDIWIGDWNGRDTTNDGHVPARDWSHDQRIHQYRGPHTDKYGGVRINIDSDYCNSDAVSARTLN